MHCPSQLSDFAWAPNAAHDLSMRESCLTQHKMLISASLQCVLHKMQRGIVGAAGVGMPPQQAQASELDCQRHLGHRQAQAQIRARHTATPDVSRPTPQLPDLQQHAIFTHPTPRTVTCRLARDKAESRATRVPKPSVSENAWTNASTVPLSALHEIFPTTAHATPSLLHAPQVSPARHAALHRLTSGLRHI